MSAMQHPSCTRTRIVAIALGLLILPISVLAAEPAHTIEAVTDRPDALYERGEPVTFRVQLKQGDRSIPGERIAYTLTIDGVGSLGEGTVATAGEPVSVQASLSEPGFIRCELVYEPPTTRPVRAIAAAGVEPEKIVSSLPVPPDFDAFWARQRKILSAAPIKPVFTIVDSPDPVIETYDVQIACPAPADNVSGYLARPKGAAERSLPAILYPHSAGVRDSDLNHAVHGAQFGAIAFDFNAHGLPNGQGAAFYKSQYPDGPLAGYPSRGLDDRDTMYFRGMYLRLLRALDFLTTLPEWDGRTLIVEGSSQGGGQALVAAGLDPRVTLCLANVPAMCNHTGPVANQPAGWPKLLQPGLDGHLNATHVQVARYFDAMNFATRIGCPTIVSVGFVDKTCAPTSIFAAYNNIPAGVEKKMVMRPHMAHAFPPDLVAAWDDVIRAHIAERKRQK